MHILVTGAGGFIGSHLVDALLSAGHDVRALIRYNSRNDRGHLQHLSDDTSPKLKVIAADVTDAHVADQIVRDCEVIFHLAALIGIPYSYYAPAAYVHTNIVGTLNILEACRRASIKRVIVTSTSEVYGTARYTPIDEGHPLQAQSPYAASKIAADKLAESYFRSFGLPVVILRPFNTFGPRQSARAVIPTVLIQGLAGNPEIRLGNLTPQRDWVFIDDTVRAFVLAAEAPGIDGETIHFGTGSATCVRDVAKRCLAAIGSGASIVGDADRKRPVESEVDLLLCSPAKAERLLGWAARVSLDEGIARVADYIRCNSSQYRSGDYVL